MRSCISEISIPINLDVINRELNQLFPSTASDLKVCVTAMKAFLENRDFENAYVQKLQFLKERLLQAAMTETPEKIEQVFNEQITKRIRRYNRAVKQMRAIEKQQRVFNSMNVKKDPSSPVNSFSKQIQLLSPKQVIQRTIRQDFSVSYTTLTV